MDLHTYTSLYSYALISNTKWQNPQDYRILMDFSLITNRACLYVMKSGSMPRGKTCVWIAFDQLEVEPTWVDLIGSKSAYDNFGWLDPPNFRVKSSKGQHPQARGSTWLDVLGAGEWATWWLKLPTGIEYRLHKIGLSMFHKAEAYFILGLLYLGQFCFLCLFSTLKNKGCWRLRGTEMDSRIQKWWKSGNL